MEPSLPSDPRPAPGPSTRSLPSPSSPSPTSLPGARHEFRVLWLLATIAAAAALGALAGLLQLAGFAPVGLMPISLGLGMAIAAEQLGRLWGLRAGRGWVFAAIVWTLVAITSEEAIGHQAYLRERQSFEDHNAKAALFKETDAEDSRWASLLRYWRGRFEKAPALMLTDAALTLLSAIAWTEFRLRQR